MLSKFIDKAARGENFQSNWVNFMFIRQFGQMADVERDAGESNDERIKDYNAKIASLKEANKKSE